MTRRGENAIRAARGRLLVESSWLPTTFLTQSRTKWSEDGENSKVILPVAGQEKTAILKLGANGQLKELRLQRWSDLTPDKKYGLIPFAALCQAEATFGDYTVPSQIRAVWWPETAQEFEFFRATVNDINFSS